MFIICVRGIVVVVVEVGVCVVVVVIVVVRHVGVVRRVVVDVVHVDGVMGGDIMIGLIGVVVLRVVCSCCCVCSFVRYCSCGWQCQCWSHWYVLFDVVIMVVVRVVVVVVTVRVAAYCCGLWRQY